MSSVFPKAARKPFGACILRFHKRTVTVENCLARELIERKSLLPAAGMYREAGETVLLSVGRFCEAKNFEAIPKICTVLLKRGLSVKWYILGYGDREAQIRESIQAVHMEDFVVLLGKRRTRTPTYVCATFTCSRPFMRANASPCGRRSCSGSLSSSRIFPPRTASCETAQTA